MTYDVDVVYSAVGKGNNHSWQHIPGGRPLSLAYARFRPYNMRKLKANDVVGAVPVVFLALF